MTKLNMVLLGAGLGLAFVVGTRAGGEAPEPAPPQAAPTERVRVVRTAPDPSTTERLVRHAVREELGNPIAHAPEDADGAADIAPLSEEQIEARSATESLVIAALGSGRWSADDAAALRVSSAQLDGDDLVEIHGRLMAALDAGDLVLEFEGPLF